ncbi:MAG: ribosome small subunit-dependent GTPase A [Armatimonadota bacterium]
MTVKFQEKQRLDNLLAALHKGERQKLYKRAGKLRNTLMSKEGRAPSLDELVLRLLDNEQPADDVPMVTDKGRTGQVIGLVRGRAVVQCDGEEWDVPLSPALAQVQQSAVAVGDQVCLAGEPPRVAGVLPRRTRLARPDPGSAHIERILAANIDMVVRVVSTKQPSLRPRLLDRILLAIEQGGAVPLIAVTKVDLLGPEERARELARLHPYRALDIQVIPCSAMTGEGLPSLRAAMVDKVCVMVGHSGVGKSSLLNALDPALLLATNGPRKGDGKGRHTTTGSRLFRLEGGIRLIDTPGVREFGLWRMSAEEIRNCFRDFTDVALGCAFADCSHTHEPHCAVKEAVQSGRIARTRYAAYRRLLGDGEESEEPPPDISFTCARCDTPVAPEGTGSAHRNHCPRCLWSRHLDDQPGDRAAGCGGQMEPVSVWVRKGGEWAIIHRCQECGMLRSNRIAADDNELLLMSLAVRPLAQPPFRLEVVAP